MTFLPIAERELRVAARKRSTIWLRVLAALLALLIGSGFLAISTAMGISTAQFGTGLFETLTWLALATTLAAGLFFTADSLSEEKREGTLGFLFLTDLGGVDVVSGKLLATSLRGSYALLAIFPILAVTLLMGGVTGGQFWRTSLALVNALFCSLAAGLLVSSVSRDSQWAMAGTFLLLLIVCAGGPLIDSIRMGLTASRFKPLLSLTSPAYAFLTALAWGRTGFWPGLLISHLMAWFCLVLAGLLVRRTWQDRPRSRSSGSGMKWRRAGTRQKLFNGNPVVWFAFPARWQFISAWAVALLILFSFCGLAATLPSMVWIVWSQLSWVVLMGLYLWIASQACRFFVDARRSGLLELLLVTPLTGKEIVEGQWRALLRCFGLPLLVFVLVQAAAGLFSQRASFGMMSAAAGFAGVPWFVQVLTSLVTALGMTANLVALMWVGMWMGLTTTSGSIAALKTLVFVQVLPWLVISAVSIMLSMAIMFSITFRNGMAVATSSKAFMLSFPLLIAGISAVLTVAKDAAWFGWARKRLRERFREEAARSVRSELFSKRFDAPPLPTPPVISLQG